jgi:2-polyprenyl-6-methoxyphenol hydroxylase-like FAD-dependent oxidoreductase
VPDALDADDGALRAIIVGGSLAGLVGALALARSGVAVTVLERSQPDLRYGGGLAVDGALVARVTGVTDFVGNSPGSAYPAPWATLRTTFREAAEADPRIRIHHRTRVVEIEHGELHASALAADGRRFDGDLLLGADGHRSLVRRYVAPHHPNADFAGYVIWLGMVEESLLDYPGPPPERWDMLQSGSDILFGVPVPGADGSLEPGRRRIGWAWYDGWHNDVLHETGAVLDGVVQHSVRPADVPGQTLDDLAEAAGRWPRPWRDAIQRSIADRGVLGTPIAEYVPHALASGRLAIMGNAAHVPTPMTGQGFESSVRDAEALARILGAVDAAAVPARLAEYERVRLEDVRRLVQGGQRFSRSFTRSYL